MSMCTSIICSVHWNADLVLVCEGHCSDDEDAGGDGGVELQDLVVVLVAPVHQVDVASRYEQPSVKRRHGWHF